MIQFWKSLTISDIAQIAVDTAVENSEKIAKDMDEKCLSYA